MRVFLSWSGLRSKGVARALRDWLPDILQYARPWMSDIDISAGGRWSPEIAKVLETADFGVVCLTPENANATWLAFEAGALAKSFSEGAVCPYLIDLAERDLAGPLTQFQAKKADREGTFSMLKAINQRAELPVPDASIERLFEDSWPRLARELAQSEAMHPESVQPARSNPDVLEALVVAVRDLERRFSGIERKLLPATPRPRTPGSGIVISPRTSRRAGELAQVEFLRLPLTVDMVAQAFVLPPKDYGKTWVLSTSEGVEISAPRLERLQPGTPALTLAYRETARGAAGPGPSAP